MAGEHVRGSKLEGLTHPFWLGDGGSPVARDAGSFKKLRAAIGSQPAENQGLQAYNRKELNSSNDEHELAGGFFLGASDKNMLRLQRFSLSSKPS